MRRCKCEEGIPKRRWFFSIHGLQGQLGGLTIVMCVGRLMEMVAVEGGMFIDGLMPPVVYRE